MVKVLKVYILLAECIFVFRMFVTETGSVYCAVRTESLNVIQMILVSEDLMLRFTLYSLSY